MRRVIGIGNPDCGDDGVGRLVARLLRGNVPADVMVEEQNGTAAEIIECLDTADSVFLIDAAVTGAPAGTIHRLDCTKANVIPTRSGASSHGLGLAEAIGLARALDHLPPVCVLHAVEGVAFAPGDAMSPQVRVAAEVLAARLARDLRCC